MSVDNASAISRLSAHALSYAPPPSSPGLGVYDNTPLDVDSDGFLQSSHRAGGPYLCSLPALNIFSHPDWIMSREVNNILKKIDCILREAGIEYISLQATGRAPMVDPENGGIPTLLITVPNDVPCGNWRDITKKIWNDCLSGHEPQASVEILTLDVLHEPSPFPIEATDRIYSKWPQIRDSILEELDTEEWTGLECWRYGRWQERTRSPPTVIVSIKLDSVRGFNQDTKKILQILTQNDVEDCAVLFMKDEFRRYSYIHDLVPLARLTQCSQQAKPGMSIGIRDSSATSSTLGGVVELQMEGDSNWRRFNLACFHSIYPALPSEQEKLREIPGAQDSLERWKWNAPGFDDPLVKKVLQVDQPSLFDVEYAMKRARGDENDTKRAEFQKFLDDKSYYLGEVCAGSGLQRTKDRVIEDGASKPCLMDWALIDVVKGRQGPNQPYHYDDQKLAPFTNVLDTLPQPKAKVHNTGRKIGSASAEFSPLVQVQIVRERDVNGNLVTNMTYERGIANDSMPSLSQDKPSPDFSRPGDAGSFVVASDGSVVGMLVGTYVRKGTVYLTWMKDLLEDIKDVTGAAHVRLAK